MKISCWIFFFSNVPFFPNLSSFLVYTGCGSGIRRYKFNFCTLYKPKKLSQVYLEWNIDIAFSKYQKNTTKQKFKISKNYVASDLASVEACREVGGCISMSHFFVKISYLNIFSLIFWNSHQKIVSSLFCIIHTRTPFYKNQRNAIFGLAKAKTLGWIMWPQIQPW